MAHPITYYRAITRRFTQIFNEHPRSDIKAEPKKLPPTPVVINNFRKAVTKRLFTLGKRRTSLDVYLQRMEKCFNCIHREKARCSHPDCGCILPYKGWWATERCPAKNPRWIEDNGRNGV